MHKKSIEAAHKLTEDDMDADIDMDHSDLEDSIKEEKKALQKQQNQQQHDQNAPPNANKEELRSESIASLRAKAQSYTAKIREAIGHNGNEVSGSVTSGAPSVNNHHHHHPHHSLHTPDTLGPHNSSFDTPNKHSDSCDSELLDPTN